MRKNETIVSSKKILQNDDLQKCQTWSKEKLSKMEKCSEIPIQKAMKLSVGGPSSLTALREHIVRNWVFLDVCQRTDKLIKYTTYTPIYTSPPWSWNGIVWWN